MIEEPPIHCEESDLDVRAVAWFMAGLALVLMVVFVTLHFFQAGLADGHARMARVSENGAPEPRLQSHPKVDFEAFRREEGEELHRYKWLDRNAGIVEIPIERAMELTLQRGLPARAASVKQGGAP